MIGNLITQVQPQEPHPIHTLRNRLHQFPLRPHIVQHQKKQHLENDRRRNGNIPVGPIARLSGFIPLKKILGTGSYVFSRVGVSVEA